MSAASSGDGTTGERRGLGVPRTALVLLAAAVVGTGIGVAAHFAFSPAAAPRAARVPALHGQASWAPGARPAPAFGLRDQTGHVVSLASLRGRSVAMTFLDSRCREVCPLQGRALAASLAYLPRARRPVVVVVSVNPQDTPASARHAAHAWGLDASSWHWLMGSRSQLRRVWAGYHIFVRPVKGDIEHTEALYLIDRRGDERSGYLYPFLPNFVALDLGTLARESA